MHQFRFELLNGLWAVYAGGLATVAIHFMHYNFARPHKTLANPYPCTPGMAAGVDNHIWAAAAEIVGLLD